MRSSNNFLKIIVLFVIIIVLGFWIIENLSDNHTSQNNINEHSKRYNLNSTPIANLFQIPRPILDNMIKNSSLKKQVQKFSNES